LLEEHCRKYSKKFRAGYTKKDNIEAEHENYLRGRLGIPSGLGLTAPKYFEVTLKSDSGGVTVHTEGWISMFDVSERSFSNKILTSGNIPRRKGWKVIGNLWNRLELCQKPKMTRTKHFSFKCSLKLLSDRTAY